MYDGSVARGSVDSLCRNRIVSAVGVHESWASAVGIVTRPWLEVHVGDTDLGCVFSKVSWLDLRPIRLLFSGYRRLFPRG
jgi:hypothetical protein